MDAFKALFSDLPVIDCAYIRTLIQMARKYHMDSAGLLSSVGLRAACLQEIDQRVSVNQFIELLRLVDRDCPDAAWAVKYGQSLSLVHHGLLSMPLLYRDNAEELASNGLAMISMRLPLCQLSSSVNGKQLTINIEDLWAMGGIRQRIVEMYIGTLDRFISQLNKRYTLCLSERDPGLAERLGELLGCDVQDGQPTDKLVLHDFDDGNYLPPMLRNSEAPNLSAQSQQTLLMIRRHIMCDPGRGCTPEQVAERLGTTTRTLNRYLKSAGQSFSQIRNEVRAAHARHYLARTRKPIIEIAERLGYSDQASFSKAFRSWTGVNPGDYRKQPLDDSRDMQHFFNAAVHDSLPELAGTRTPGTKKGPEGPSP